MVRLATWCNHTAGRFIRLSPEFRSPRLHAADQDNLPHLHHSAALGQMSSAVVRAAVRIFHRVGELVFDPVNALAEYFVSTVVPSRGSRAQSFRRCYIPFVAAQPGLRLADRALRTASAWEDIRPFAGEGLYLSQDRHGLIRQRN